MARFKTAKSLSADQRQQGRRWIVIFVIILLLVLGGKIYAWTTGRRSPVDIAITTITTPVVYVIKRIGDGVTYTFTVIASFPTLLRERNELSSENALLERRIDELEHLALENNQLQGLLKLDVPAGYKPVASNVISRPYDLWLESAVISADTKDGVRLGNLVVNEQGVVGKITEVGPGFSRVQLVSSPKFRLGAISGSQGSSSRAEGVIRGVSGNELAFDYLTAGSGIAIGDKVFTMGEESYPGGDNNRPRGLLIGTVVSRVADRNGFLQVAVEPAANPNRIGTVVVMTR